MENLGEILPFWSILPFVGMLLSIALIPLFSEHFWNKYQPYIVIFWSALFLIPFLFGFEFEDVSSIIFETVWTDYLPFIVLLFGLFTISGGVVIEGRFAGTPLSNAVLLLIGTFLSSIIGTTGASMIMIRPILKANSHRQKRSHIVIFFIFLVSNIGGCLTPLGDPPLFLGFLRGVPFFWTLRLFPILVLNTLILLIIFYFWDRKLSAAETPQIVVSENNPKIRIRGRRNLWFLGMIIAALALQLDSPIQMLIILLATFLSRIVTSKDNYLKNNFSFHAIKEVAILFFGIFITMIPVLEILKAKGSEFGITKPIEFFWSTGILSSFLDNAPTYLVFATVGGSLPAAPGVENLVLTIGKISPSILMAVSAGAVFMGAITYIGNAPNFMVKSIAEHNSIKMPSFFGYIGYSLSILVPIFLIDSVIFFW